MQARIMGRPAVQRRTFQFGFLLLAAMLADSAAALDFQALTPLQGTGHNLDLKMVSSGRGHLVYRRPRRGEVYYQHFNGTSWSNEVQVNDATSLATSRKLDVNQPRIALDGAGGVWISW